MSHLTCHRRPKAAHPSLLAVAVLSMTSVGYSQEVFSAAQVRFEFDRAIHLDVERQRMAVELMPGTDVEVWGPLHAPGAKLTSHPLRGWWYLEWQDWLPSLSALSRRLDDLSDLSSVALVSPVLRSPEGLELLVSRDLLVGFEPWIDRRGAFQRLERHGEILDEAVAGLEGVYRLRVASRHGLELIALANGLAQERGVHFADLDWWAEAVPGTSQWLVPNDPGFAMQWGLRNTGQPIICPSFGATTPGIDVDAMAAWQVTKGDPGVIVLVLDNGVQLNHPDLYIAPGLGADFTGEGGGGGPVTPCDNHGTAVAGIIAATANNGNGIAGLAPASRVATARISVVNSSCNSWWVGASWVADALQWGFDQGARVSNTSWRFDPHPLITLKYQETRSAGMVHFASSMNEGMLGIAYPANLASVNAVGAIDRAGNLAPFSNYGPGQAFVAPGVGIYTLDRTGPAGYTFGDITCMDGTSAAAPFAAGCAALLLAVNPSWTPAQVELAMRLAAQDLGAPGHDPFYGWGLVRAGASLGSVLTPQIHSIEPSQVPILSVDQPNRITLTGPNLGLATAIALDGVPLSGTPAFEVLDANAIRFSMPLVGQLGLVTVAVTSPLGTATTQLSVVANDPPAIDLEHAFADYLIQVMGIRLTLAGEPGSWMVLLVSGSLQPSVLPGLLALDIGAGFSDLLQLGYFPLPLHSGWAKAVYFPGGLPQGLVGHFQALALGSSGELRATNVQTGTILF